MATTSVLAVIAMYTPPRPTSQKPASVVTVPWNRKHRTVERLEQTEQIVRQPVRSEIGDIASDQHDIDAPCIAHEGWYLRIIAVWV
jgi:hypothetical protein